MKPILVVIALWKPLAPYSITTLLGFTINKRLKKNIGISTTAISIF